MRGLKEQFIIDLKTGILAPFGKAVLADTTLCLEIRDNYVNIYYRGGNMFRLTKVRAGYSAFFDLEYAKGDKGELARIIPLAEIKEPVDVAAWTAMLPHFKQAMDRHRGKHAKEEREAQQLILRENNYGRIARKTDYYICDIEYANPNGRFDLVGVHWPNNHRIRKNAHDRRLILMEAKYGDGAIDDPAGIHSHIRDINKFLSTTSNVRSLKKEMLKIFNQKRELDLVNCGKDLESFSDEKPMLLLLLANHDPDSKKLRKSLETRPESPHADIYIASGSFIGYGLFDQAVIPIDEAYKRLNILI